MLIHYDTKTDLLYLRFDQRTQTVINKRVTDSVVLDIGDEEKIVGIEILDASKQMQLEKLFPVNYNVKGA